MQGSHRRHADEALGARQRYGFAIGDFGFNLYWQGLGLFLIYFHTDVLGIPATWAGLAYLAASLWDCFTDPLMGFAADRTRTRWGRYRVFLLFGSAPLALSFALCFSAPDLSLPGLLAYTLATQLLVRTLYSAVAVPYSALSAAMTRDSDERTALTGLRMQCAFAGGVAVAYLMPALAQSLGGGDARRGYALAAALIGALATATLLWCFYSVREPQREEREQRSLSPRSEAREFLRVVASSGPLLRLLLAKVLIAFALSMHMRSMLYYFKYVLGNADAARYAVPVLTAASVVSVPLWVWTIRRTSKRGAWLLGSVAMAVFSLCLHLPAPLTLPVAIALLAAIAASSTAYGVCFWAMLPDTVDYNEWRYGRRDEAKVFGIAGFVQKLAMGLSAVVAGIILDGSGFIANQVQAAATVDAIRATMGLIPATAAVLSMLLIRGYIIDRGEHRRIVQALDAR